MLSLAHFHRLFSLPARVPPRPFGPGLGFAISSQDVGAGQDETYLMLITDLYLEAIGGDCLCLLEEEHADTGQWITRYQFRTGAGKTTALTWTAGLKCGDLPHHPMRQFRVRNADSSTGGLSVLVSGILVE